MLSQAPREFSEQVPRFLVAQSESGQGRRKPPAGLAPELDPEEALALQGLAVVGADDLRHQPQGGLPLPLLLGETSLEDVRGVGGSHQVVGDVIDVGGLVVGGPGQRFEDETPVLDGLVARFQVGREEGGRLTAVAEQQQLAALSGLVSFHFVIGGGKRLVESGSDHGGGGVSAGFELPDHGGTTRPASQAAGDGVLGRGKPPHRPQQGPSAGHARAGLRSSRVQGAADGAQDGVVGVEGAAGFLERLVILVDDRGRIAEQKPGPALRGTLLRPEDQPVRGVPDRTGQVDGTAALAGGELEHGGRAGSAGLPAGEGNVRARLGQAGVGPLAGPGEQVIASRQDG